MNKLTLMFSILTVMVAVSCKKEETPAPTTAIQGPALLSNMCTAQINGVTFTANEYETDNYAVGFKVYFRNGDKRLTFTNYSSNLQPGVYPLKNSYDPFDINASYVNGSTFYSVDTGLININEIVLDTTGTSTKLRRFVATFNFNTDTISGNHFNITSGSAVYINNY